MRLTDTDIETLRQETQMKAMHTTFVNLPAATVLALLDLAEDGVDALDELDDARQEILLLEAEVAELVGQIDEDDAIRSGAV